MLYVYLLVSIINVYAIDTSKILSSGYPPDPRVVIAHSGGTEDRSLLIVLLENINNIDTEIKVFTTHY